MDGMISIKCIFSITQIVPVLGAVSRVMTPSGPLSPTVSDYCVIPTMWRDEMTDSMIVSTHR